MVLSRHSVLGSLAGVTRRVTLVTDPIYSTSTGSWLVNGLDADKQQWQIDLTSLPPRVTKDMIKSGQQWFIERSTTYNRLYKYVGEFMAENQIKMATIIPPSLPMNTWDDITYNTYVITQSGSAGITTYSAGYFNAPFPGLYAVTTYLTLNGSPMLSRVYAPVLDGYYPTSMYTNTETLRLTSGNLSFKVQGFPTTTGTIAGYVSVTYSSPFIYY